MSGLGSSLEPPPEPRKIQSSSKVTKAIGQRFFSVRSFEKGLADGEGVGAKKSFLRQRLRPLFCTLFPIPPQEKGDTLLQNFFFGLFLGAC